MDQQDSERRDGSRWTPIEAYRRTERPEARPEPRSFTSWEPSALRRLEEDVENG